MGKWADFCISEVRYDTEHRHITHVNVHKDNGDSIAPPKTYMREEIVDAIRKEVSFITIFKDSNGKWLKGQEVMIIVINRKEYIQTENNNKEIDNLESLPEF